MRQSRTKSSRIDPADERRKKLGALYRVGGMQSDADAIVLLVCDRLGVNDLRQARALLEQEYVYGRRTKGGRPHFLKSILKDATGRDNLDIPNVMLYLTEQVLLEWMRESGTMVARSAEIAGERFLNEILQMRIDDLPKDLWNRFINRLADVYAKKERRLRMSADAAKSICRIHPTWSQFEKDLRLDALPILKEYIDRCLRDQDLSLYFREVIQLYDDRDFFWNFAVPIAMKHESFSKVFCHGAVAFYFCMDAGAKFFQKVVQTFGIFTFDDLCEPEHERLKIGSGDPCDKLRLSYRRVFYRGLEQCVLGFMEQAAREGPPCGWNDQVMMRGQLHVYDRVRRAADEAYDRVRRAADEARPNYSTLIDANVDDEA
jgi:hypothetical protein